MDRPYPEHIYEPIRKVVAISLLKREFKKLNLDSSELKMPTSERDFWNGFHGMIMGFKLIIGLTQFITAENVNWRLGEIDPKELIFGGGLSVEKLKDQPDIADTQPIIVVDKHVHDGNNRLAYHLKTNQDKINAYIGEYTTEEKFPKNFWVPTSYLMEFVATQAVLKEYEATLTSLRKIIEISESAKYELENRVLIGENEFRMKLRKDLIGE